MTTLVWKVKCDSCGKTINALEEEFFTSENGDQCLECEQKYGAL